MQNKVLRIICLSLFVLAFGLFCASFSGEFMHYIYSEGPRSGTQNLVTLKASDFFETPLIMFLVLLGLLFGLLLALFVEKKEIRFLGLGLGLAGFAYSLYVAISIINVAIDTEAKRTNFYNMEFSPCLYLYFISVFLFGALLVIALFNSVLSKSKKNLETKAV